MPEACCRNREFRKRRHPLLPVVPGESLDRDGHMMLSACFAGQPAVWAEPAYVRFDYRSRRRSATAEIALGLQLWESSGAAASPTSASNSRECR